MSDDNEKRPALLTLDELQAAHKRDHDYYFKHLPESGCYVENAYFILVLVASIAVVSVVGLNIWFFDLPKHLWQDLMEHL